MANTTIDAADEFDNGIFSERDATSALKTIARFVREHCADAHVTRNGRVLLRDPNSGSLRSVRTMRAAAEWLGY